MIVLDPAVLDTAKKMTGSRSYDQLGQAFLGKTGTTLRNWAAGKSVPDAVTLMRLKQLTGLPLDTMLLGDPDRPAAA